jgi:hypothetical protein
LGWTSTDAKRRSATPDYQAKAAEARRRRYEDPEAVAKMLANMSAAARRKYEDQAERDKSSVAAKRRYEDQDERDKTAEAQRRHMANPEKRAVVAESTRRTKNTPEGRVKATSAARLRSADPVWKAKNAEAQGRRWFLYRAAKRFHAHVPNPEVREMVLATLVLQAATMPFAAKLSSDEEQRIFAAAFAAQMVAQGAA